MLTLKLLAFAASKPFVNPNLTVERLGVSITARVSKATNVASARVWFYPHAPIPWRDQSVL